MTATVGEISQALGSIISANCQTPDGKQLRYLPYLGDTINPPVVLVGIKEVQFHAAMARGNVPHTFDVLLILQRAADRATWQALEGYMSAAGPSSVALAIETQDASGARSLGGVVQDCLCVKAGPPEALKFEGSDAVYVSLPFAVQVIA